VPSVRLASYNAHWGLHRYGGDLDLTAIVAALDADVVCLQEVWRRADGHAAHEVAARALGYHLVEARIPRAHNRTAPNVVRAADGDRSWWGLALLSRYPVATSREHDLGAVVADEGRRRALEVELIVDGGPFVVVCTHLTWRAWGIPHQLWRLRRVLPRAPRPGAVAGDCNMWGPVVETALPGWRRAVRGRTWVAPRPRHQLDHVLVNRPVEVLDATVGADTGSDHLPVRATLRF